MVETVQDLSEADLGNFCYHIFKNSHPLHWEHRPDQEGRELARLVNKMLEAYPELLQTVEQQIAKPNIRPSIEEMVAMKERPHGETAEPTSCSRRTTNGNGSGRRERIEALIHGGVARLRLRTTNSRGCPLSPGAQTTPVRSSSKCSRYWRECGNSGKAVETGESS